MDVIGQQTRDRIKWVHGNLCVDVLFCLSVPLLFTDVVCSLDGLPFDDDEFDLVRMARIGQGVPEDEVGRRFRRARVVSRLLTFWISGQTLSRCAID